jgi:hypothetical protein
MYSLPEIFFLRAAEPPDLLCHSLKHLALQIRVGNWANWSVPA